MKATITNQNTVQLSQFFSGLNLSDWLWSNSDVGAYYAPTIEFATRHYIDTDSREVRSVDIIQVVFPNSRVTVTSSGSIEITGLRGSIEDCILPILCDCGIDLDSTDWVVSTTRPDVRWYKRAGGE